MVSLEEGGDGGVRPDVRGNDDDDDELDLQRDWPARGDSKVLAKQLQARYGGDGDAAGA